MHGLDAVGNLVTRRQRVAHAVRAHGLAVANHRRVRDKRLEAVVLQLLCRQERSMARVKRARVEQARQALPPSRECMRA